MMYQIKLINDLYTVKSALILKRFKTSDILSFWNVRLIAGPFNRSKNSNRLFYAAFSKLSSAHNGVQFHCNISLHL